VICEAAIGWRSQASYPGCHNSYDHLGWSSFKSDTSAVAVAAD
jgi:hypothetical protein